MTNTLILTLLFGLCIGSFLNVCIYRLPLQLSVLNPRRSFCPKCNSQLSWSENIPVISWLALRGKCAHCRSLISGEYPLVELLSAFAAAACYIRFGLNGTGLVLYALCCALIAVSFIDLRHKIIPNAISFPGITIGLLLSIASQFTDFFSPPITSGTLDSLLGMLAGGGFFYVIAYLYYLITKQHGLGMGDVKLMALTGSLLGINSVVPTIFAGSVLGAIFGIAMIIFRGGNRKSEIPFGPWLSIGAILYIFDAVPMI